MQSRNLVVGDGMTLVHRTVPAPFADAPVAFVTHSQAQHSLNLRETLEGIAAKGWQVHSTDLRGHGYSTSDRYPLGHMDIGSGWEALVGDLIEGLQFAFKDTEWSDRLVVAPNIGGPLILEVLKVWPDLARHIVLAAPPPNQPAIMKLARSFARARALFHPVDKPDDLTMHQLYTFLGARLTGRKRLIDVISSDTVITDALLEDPYAWPTPTTGYFHELFRGIEKSWQWPKNAKVQEGTRFLVLYGGDDPMTANGKFVAPMRDHLMRMGGEKVDAFRIEGGRSGLFIEERKFGISNIIARWTGGEELVESVDPTTDLATLSTGVLNGLGLGDPDRELNADELVELCYNAINDEASWIEMLYRVSYAISANNALDDSNLEAIILALMPHWDRSFNLNRQIMQSAALGAVLNNVIDRFSIGMAVVSPDMDVTYANERFIEDFAALTGENGLSGDRLEDMTRLLNATVEPSFRHRCRQGSGEALLMFDGQPVGFHFRPPALKQTALQRGGSAGVIILRTPGTSSDKDAGTNPGAELLQFAYGLTVRETEAALGLLDGLSPDAIARKYGVTINTIRTHLKRIYEKVGVQGQTELAARLLKGPVGLIISK